MSVIHALHWLEPGHVLRKSSPGMSDSAGQRRTFGNQGQGLSSLIPWHSAVFPIYMSAAGQNALSESCSCFGKASQATFIWL